MGRSRETCQALASARSLGNFQNSGDLRPGVGWRCDGPHRRGRGRSLAHLAARRKAWYFNFQPRASKTGWMKACSLQPGFVLIFWGWGALLLVPKGGEFGEGGVGKIAGRVVYSGSRGRRFSSQWLERKSALRRAGEGRRGCLAKRGSAGWNWGYCGVEWGEGQVEGRGIGKWYLGHGRGGGSLAWPGGPGLNGRDRRGAGG